MKDHETTMSTKLFTNGLGTPARWNLMMGLPKDTPHPDTIRTIRDRISDPLPPVHVQSGPVKDHIIKGADVDLFQIPVPKWHPLDGGRYINTFNGAITRDPDTGMHNVGLYRGMISGRNKIGVFMVPHKDWGIVYEKYKLMGKPMPVAFVYGWDPSLLAVAGSPFVGCEYDLAGAIRQQPVELTGCETSDIEVPASAEMVIEATMSVDAADYAIEGPFGEGSGYYGGAGVRPVVEVSCITHRDDPIFRGSLVGVKDMDELKLLGHNAISAGAWQVLDSQEIPGILDVSVGMITLIKIKKTYQGQPRQIAAALWGSKFAGQIYNILMVVEDDVNIHNFNEVLGALHGKVNFNRDLVVFPLYMGSPVDPGIPAEKRDELEYGSGIQYKLLIDATTDWEIYPKREEWGNRRYPQTCNNQLPEIEELVKRRWPEYGL
jgi:UbiD family decarboxylase